MEGGRVSAGSNRTVQASEAEIEAPPEVHCPLAGPDGNCAQYLAASRPALVSPYPPTHSITTCVHLVVEGDIEHGYHLSCRVHPQRVRHHQP